MPLNITPEAIDKLGALDPGSRRALLGRFSPQEQDELIAALKTRAAGAVQPDEVFGLPGGKDLPTPSPTPTGNLALDAVANAAVGAGRSLADTGINAVRAVNSKWSPVGMVRRGLEGVGIGEGSLDRDEEALKRIEAAIGKPQGPTQETAKTLTDFASLIGPSPAKGGMLLNAAAAAAPTFIKSGGDATETLIAAGMGGAASKIGKKIFTPFAEHAVDVPSARRLNIELPASAKSTQALTAELEALAGKGIGGQRIVDRAQKAMLDLDLAAEALEKGGALRPLDRSSAGQIVASSLERSSRALKDLTDNAYAGMDLSQHTTVPMRYYDAIVEQLDQVGQSVGVKNPLVDRLSRMKKSLEIRDPRTGQLVGIRELTAKELDQTRKEINRRAFAKASSGAKDTGNTARLKKLGRIIEDEIDQALPGNLQAQRDLAKAQYREMVGKVNSFWARSFRRFAKDGNWTGIADKAADLPPDAIAHMRTVLDPTAMDAVKATRLADLFNSARTADGITGQKLQRLVQQNDEQLKALLNQSEYAKLLDIAETAGALSKSQRIIKGSQTGFLGRLLGYGVALTNSPLYFVKAIMTEAGMNSFLASDVGQRWLTNGWQRGARGVSRAGKAAVAGVVTGLEREKEEVELRKPLERQIAEPIGAR